ncbi:MAG TPA: HNH endonuclease signature motif containing protein [Actinomycetota bacterium]
MQRAIAALPTHADAVEEAAVMLREADALQARALGLLVGATPTGAGGLGAETALSFAARLLPWEARVLCGAAEAVRAMPRLAACLAEGIVSASQARAIARACRDLRGTQRDAVDVLVARRSPALREAEPDQLVAEVEDLAARLRSDLATRREQRMIDASFLVLQPALGGGGSLYAQADPESFATIAAALDAAADPPVAGEGRDEPSDRAVQRFDALVGICEASMSDADTTVRPRPRFLVSLQLRDDRAQLAGDLTRLGDDAASILGNVAGRPQRLSPLATRTLLCDAEVIPVVFDGAQPIAAGRVRTPVPDRTRRAIVARDGGCRFPGCRAPAAWSDVHHVRAGARRTHEPSNLVLLCRRCHRRVHRYGWRITHDGDAVRFDYRGRSMTSYPRARRPRE